MATATKPANQVFTFDSMSTIGDLLNVVNTLKNAGQTPKLRLRKAYTGDFESLAVDVLELADEPSPEMAVVGEEDDAERFAELERLHAKGDLFRDNERERARIQAELDYFESEYGWTLAQKYAPDPRD
jgi:hypothetical protein